MERSQATISLQLIHIISNSIYKCRPLIPAASFTSGMVPLSPSPNMSQINPGNGIIQGNNPNQGLNMQFNLGYAQNHHQQQRQQQQQQQQVKQNQQKSQISQNGLSNSGKVSPPEVVYPAPNSEVEIMGFRSYNVCNVRSTDPVILKMYNDIISQIDSYGKHAPKMDTTPQLKSYAISSIFGKFWRVQIISGTDQKYRVLFIDLGCESSRNIKELFQITNHFIQLNRYSCPVQLRLVPQKEIYGQEGRILDKLKNIKLKIVYFDNESKGSDIRCVELINIKNMESINQKIIKQCSNEIQQNVAKENGNEKNNSTLNQNMSKQKHEKPKQAPEKPKQVPEKPKQESTNIETLSKVISPAASVQSLAKSVTSSGGIRNRLKNAKKSLEKSQTANKPVMKPPFKLQKLDKDTNLKVIVLDTSVLEQGIFGAILASDMAHLQEISNFIRDEFKPDTLPYKPM